MADLGRLEPLDPRQVWSHEAQDFTPWLLDNADTLAEALGLDIELTTAEHPVGDFALDLVGRDLTNDCVLIVENQLSPTDHGHLGQLITYAAGTDAHTIVWLSPTFREEHCQALDYLNTLGGENARFFGVQIGVVRIDNSKPAPMFNLRAQPNDWHAKVAADAKRTSRQAGKAPPSMRRFGLGSWSASTPSIPGGPTPASHRPSTGCRCRVRSRADPPTAPASPRTASCEPSCTSMPATRPPMRRCSSGSPRSRTRSRPPVASSWHGKTSPTDVPAASPTTARVR
jgi:hypothetical protein